MSEPGPSTSQAEASTDIDVEAATLLSKGRSFLLKDDAPNAVQNLQEACELLGSKYGELAKECGECYYYYGWALLELARLENDVLGNALDGVPEDEDTDQATTSADKPDNVEDPEKVDSDNEGEGDEGEEDGDEDDAKGAEAASAEEQDDEDISNFQLSWEMLELARIIFSQQEGDEFTLKVSQVYLKLGELGLERGNYAQSVDDFTLCLKTQTEQLSKDSRLLAETHYNLALAYSFDQKFDKAIENFELSTNMIQNRITMLENKPTEGRTDEELAQDQKEIKELKALIPEIKLKIDDAKAEKNTLESAVGQALRSASAEFGLGTSSSSSPSTSGFHTGCSSSGVVAKPIAVRKPTDAKPDDISHLMHRKRNLEVESEQGTAGKKARQEGSGDASSASNAASTEKTPDTASADNAPVAAKAANGDCPATADGSASNGLEQTTMNGNAKASPEQIKTKKVEQTSNGDAPAAPMES